MDVDAACGRLRWTAGLLRVGHVFLWVWRRRDVCRSGMHALAWSDQEEVKRNSDVSASPRGINSVLGDGGFVHGE